MVASDPRKKEFQVSLGCLAFQAIVQGGCNPNRAWALTCTEKEELKATERTELRRSLEGPIESWTEHWLVQVCEEMTWYWKNKAEKLLRWHRPGNSSCTQTCQNRKTCNTQDVEKRPHSVSSYSGQIGRRWELLWTAPTPLPADLWKHPAGFK